MTKITIIQTISHTFEDARSLEEKVKNPVDKMTASEIRKLFFKEIECNDSWGGGCDCCNYAPFEGVNSRIVYGYNVETTEYKVSIANYNADDIWWRFYDEQIVTMAGKIKWDRKEWRNCIAWLKQNLHEPSCKYLADALKNESYQPWVCIRLNDKFPQELCDMICKRYGLKDSSIIYPKIIEYKVNVDQIDDPYNNFISLETLVQIIYQEAYSQGFNDFTNWFKNDGE